MAQVAGRASFGRAMSKYKESFKKSRKVQDTQFGEDNEKVAKLLKVAKAGQKALIKVRVTAVTPGVNAKGDPYVSFVGSILAGPAKGMPVSQYQGLAPTATSTVEQKQEALFKLLQRFGFETADMETEDVEAACAEITKEKPVMSCSIGTSPTGYTNFNINKALEDTEDGEDGDSDEEEETEEDADDASEDVDESDSEEEPEEAEDEAEEEPEEAPKAKAGKKGKPVVGEEEAEDEPAPKAGKKSGKKLVAKEPDPEPGDAVDYMNPRSKKVERCAIVKVNFAKETCILKRLKDKELLKDVPFTAFEPVYED